VVDALRGAGADVQRFDARDVAAVVAWLAGQQVTSLLVEGGPTLQQAMWDAGLVDRVQWVETPVRLGSGVPAAAALSVARRSLAGSPLALGSDLLMEWDVHRTD
jgi:riboflavin biosynthesis pyrimidine reductase